MVQPGRLPGCTNLYHQLSPYQLQIVGTIAPEWLLEEIKAAQKSRQVPPPKPVEKRLDRALPG